MEFRGFKARWHLEFYSSKKEWTLMPIFWVDGTWEEAVTKCATLTRTHPKWRVSPTAVLLDN